MEAADCDGPRNHVSRGEETSNHHEPMLLGTYRRRRYESDPGDRPVRVFKGMSVEKATQTSVGICPESEINNHAEVHTLYSTPPTESQGAKPKPTILDSQNEFDEYGTELHRDARVWKVYVQETDKFDEELVKGWNDSTDVILIFAALFSAISTAFLIESSKMLQPDPTDVSAQTLAVISRTLLTLANGTQLQGTVIPPADESTEFIPSRTAIYVNTLWFLSLSLSLATSFIAILSKDWCHSFMSGRTGHPYAQTFRRQQKWDMLEQWKMSELLAVLPSMIHLALLLFSIGLCILLWDINSVVAIPVVCISGIAFGFYACSSIAAITIDFFPYPTIISKLCRTNPAQLTFHYLYRGIPKVIMEAVPVIVTQGPPNLAWYLIYLVVRPFEYLVDHLAPVIDWLRKFETSSQSLRLLVGLPSQKVWSWLQRRALFNMRTDVWIHSWFEKPNWTLEWTDINVRMTSPGGNHGTETGEQTSLALSWLIKNCETPQSVDIALQSIAGATSRIPPQPLLDCQAPLQILRRIASSNLYRNLDTNSETVVSLYVRSLSFLGTSANSNFDKGGTKGSELEASIWDLQMESEKKLAALIEEGNFEPTQQNLHALRIGNTAASNSLKILQKKIGHTDVDGIFDSIITYLQSYRTHGLHDAALLSLVHATTLLLLLSPASIDSGPDQMELLPELSITTGNFPESSGGRGWANACALLFLCRSLAEHPSRLISGLATKCILLYNTANDRTRHGGLPWLEEALRGLIETYSQGGEILQSIYNVEPPEFTINDLVHDPQSYFSRLDSNFLMCNQTQNFLTRLESKTTRISGEKIISAELRAILAVRHLAPITVQGPAMYFLVVEVMCHTLPLSPLWTLGAQVLSRYPFPALSEELITVLEQRNTVPLLESHGASPNETKRYFAKGQLWLLFSLYIYRHDDTSSSDKLKAVLITHGRGNKSENDHHWDLGESLYGQIDSRSRTARELGIWALRLEECVRQSRGMTIWQYLHDALFDVPLELRGLSSFTALPRPAEDFPPYEPQSVEDLAADVWESDDVADSTGQCEGPTGSDGHSQKSSLVACAEEARTRGQDVGLLDSSQDLEVTTQEPMNGDEGSVVEISRQRMINEVHNRENSAIHSVGYEWRVADSEDTVEATSGPQPEGEVTEDGEVGQGGRDAGAVVIQMGKLEDRPSRSLPSI